MTGQQRASEKCSGGEEGWGDREGEGVRCMGAWLHGTADYAAPHICMCEHVYVWATAPEACTPDRPYPPPFWTSTTLPLMQRQWQCPSLITIHPPLRSRLDRVATPCLHSIGTWRTPRSW